MRLSEVLVKFILVFLLYLFCIYFITTAAIICREYKDSHNTVQRMAKSLNISRLK